jgi:alpha-beta hydrolase superfamily lysophospholipase
MTQTEYSWQLSGRKIFAQAWFPESTPKAIVNLVHGLGEHSGRYHRWGELFAGEGYALVVMDLLGHGRSEGQRGHIKSYQELLDQVDLMLEKAIENFSSSPRVLYGHSMGGNIVINYAISKDPPISALIASSPWLKLVIPISPLERTFSRLANFLLPGLSIPAKGLGAEKLSHDPEHWEEVRKDPLIHRKVSVRCAYEIMNRGEYALRHVYRINKPFLLMHGNADEITSQKASEEFVANTSERTRLKIWDGLRHELHSELEYKEVFGFIIDWLNEITL